MQRVLAASIAVLLLFCFGCYSAPIMPPNGFLYTNIDAPVSPAVAGRPIGDRKGEAISKAVLGLFAWGDASVAAAVREGGISEPRHIDYEYFNIFGIYQSFTTIVYGD